MTPFREPSTLRSQNGLLRVELRAAERELEVGGRQARVLSYADELPSPTWRVRAGDRLQVRLTNDLSSPTNLHFHGLHVSPTGNGDNPFVSVLPGEVFEYDVQVPADHPPGLFWYHPHLHGSVADQVFGGLYGAIVVEDAASSGDERVMVVSDISLQRDGSVRRVSAVEQMMGREGELLLVNGRLQPQIEVRPSATERWLVLNACTSRYLDLALPGHDLRVVGMDSGRHRHPLPVEDVLLAPGNRADLLVTTTGGPGRLQSLGHDRGSPMTAMMGGRGADLSGPAVLAVVEPAGTDAPGTAPSVPGTVQRDLRAHEPATLRQITFTMAMAMGMGRISVGFDGRPFDGARTDQTVGAGAVEEWTIRNSTPMDHPFHLHVWPMQVIDDNGTTPADPTWQDVVNVRAAGYVTVRVRFDDFTGRTVYHCHILDHEDSGMMGVVGVV
jgi:FtsP/CotA-like multicopper oxidase with cupredoxin domain